MKNQGRVMELLTKRGQLLEEMEINDVNESQAVQEIEDQLKEIIGKAQLFEDDCSTPSHLFVSFKDSQAALFA